MAEYPGGMARSPLTLAASVSAALPGVDARSVAPLTTNSAGRNDAAMVALSDGREVVVRIPVDDTVGSELATEAVALRALTDGARALVNFLIPEFLGAAAAPPSRAFVTTFVPGYQVDTANIPAGCGVASSLGDTLAQIHALPVSIVRNAGLPARAAADVRDDISTTVEDASATGRVPVRLMVRWRDAVNDEAMWQFEPTITLGGANALSFVYHDVEGVPTVAGVIDWHGLSVGDPATDLQFLQTAPDAAASVYEAYRASAHRSGDEYLRARARLHAEIEFARWLLHGRDTNDESVLDDASGLLDALADNVRDDDLLPVTEKADLDDALSALSSIPDRASTSIDTSMHTDTYDPEELAQFGISLSAPDTTVDPARASRVAAAAADTQALTDDELKALRGEHLAANTGEHVLPFGLQPEPESDAMRDDAGERGGVGERGGAGERVSSFDSAEVIDIAGRAEASDIVDPDATQPIDADLLAGANADISDAQRAAQAAINRWKVDGV